MIASAEETVLPTLKKKSHTHTNHLLPPRLPVDDDAEGRLAIVYKVRNVNCASWLPVIKTHEYKHGTHSAKPVTRSHAT